MSAVARSRPELDPDLLAKISPVTLSGEKVLPVPDELVGLFPRRGLQQGTTLGIGGRGRWSLAMALLATALGSEGWLAVVGVPDLNLATAAEYGVRLDRILVVEDPGPGRWGSVVATLLESVEVVAVAPTTPVGRRDVRRLTARTREHGGVLLHLDGARHWPEATDVSLEVEPKAWSGLGVGHGVLGAREVTVRSRGRRMPDREQATSVLLPGPDGRLAPAPVRTVDDIETESLAPVRALPPVHALAPVS